MFASKKVKDLARRELAAAVKKGVGLKFKMTKDIDDLKKLAFDQTLGTTLKTLPNEYWSGKPRDFALRNARLIGQVAAIYATAAGRSVITRTDFCTAANTVIAAARETCKKPGMVTWGIQCAAWNELKP